MKTGVRSDSADIVEIYRTASLRNCAERLFFGRSYGNHYDFTTFLDFIIKKGYHTNAEKPLSYINY